MEEVKRYVNLTFIIAAMVLSWLLVHVVNLVREVIDVSDIPILGNTVKLTTIIGIVISIFTMVLLWRNARVYNWALNVAYEMKNVTWPTMDETKYAMKVVVATSIIVALILFCFDFAAKELTGLVLGI